MPVTTTLGREKVRSALPEGYKDFKGALDKKAVGALFTRLAKNDPDSYVDTLQKLNTIGVNVASLYGRSASLSLSDFKIPPEIKARRDKLKAEVQKVYDSPLLNPEQKQKSVLQMVQEFSTTIDDDLLEAVSEQDGAFALQINSGSRGKAFQLRQMLLGNLISADSKGNPVPYPSLEGYSEGVSPIAYWAASHGGRKGYVDVQFATADGGYLSKQITNVSHRGVVTQEDCGTTQGLELDGDDPDNVGTVLAQEAGGLPAGTIIDDENSALLKDSKIIGRSALNCKAKEGICAKCAGVRETGTLPAVGDAVGVTGARSFLEPLTQSAISCLSPDTAVRMADGSTRRMDQLKVGDRIVGSDDTGATYVTTVKRIFDKGAKDIYRTTYRRGSSRNAEAIHIDCTLEHKILQATRTSGQKEDVYNNVPRQLKCGEQRRWISAVLQNAFTCDETYTHEPMALLLGLLIGDGCYTESVYSIHFSCADRRLLDDLEEYMTGLELKFSKLKGHKYYYKVSMLDGNAGLDDVRDPATGRITPGARNPVKRYLQETGMYGKYAFEKELPPDIAAWDNESIAQMLAGLYITDGSVFRGHTGNPFFSYGSTSLRLVTQIRELLQIRFGIYTSQIKQDKNMVCYFGDRKSVRRHPMYSITVASVDSVKKFMAVIPLLGAKAEKVREIGFASTKSARGNYRCSRLAQEFLRTGPVMDIEVAAESPLFVLANGMIVSNSKHVGGDLGTTKKIESGLKAVNKFFQVPKEFKGAAVLANADGKVSRVAKAPQGGQFIFVGSERHYVPDGYGLKVKQGDVVEAGDMMTEGMLNIADLVRHKGIGEGRTYFLKHLRDLLDRSNSGTNRRNLEYLTREFVNKVRVTAPEGLNGHLPDDVVNYNTIASDWEPRKGAGLKTVTTANKLYLEQPYLHYTIGTRVTPRMIKRLQSAGVKEVMAHQDPPPFEPEVIRAQDYMSTDPDLMTRMAGENLKRTVTRAATTGAQSEKKSVSYFPRLVNISEV